MWGHLTWWREISPCRIQSGSINHDRVSNESSVDLGLRDRVWGWGLEREGAAKWEGVANQVLAMPKRGGGSTQVLS